MRLLLIFIVIFAAAFLVEAAPRQEDLRWQQALELLKTNNAEYKAAKSTYQAVEAQEIGAASGYYPSLAGSLSYNQNNSQTSSGNTASSDSLNFDLAGSGRYSASLSWTQNLFSGFKDMNKVDQAKAQSRVARSTFQTAKANISKDFVTAYQSLLTAEESLKLAKNIIQRRREDLRMVELRYESGRENKGSALLSQAYLEQAQYEELQALHSAELARTSLAQFLGLAASTPLSLQDPVPVEDPPASPDFEKLAIQTPAHQSILATIDADIAGVGIAKAGFYPSLSLTGTVGSTGPEFYPRQNDRWSLVASLSIPIFDGGKDYSAVKSSSFTRNSSLSHQITVNQEALTNLQEAYQKYAESIAKLKVDEAFQKAALVRAEVARSQYNNGLISFTDWDQIENDLIARQKAYLQSKKDRVLNEAAWNQAQGQGVLP